MLCLKGVRKMADIYKVDECVMELISELPTIQNGIQIIGEDIRQINPNFDVEEIKKLKVEEGYQQFEGWLNELLQKEKLPPNIIAINFGLFETDENIQLYISGSTEWEQDDSDWACNNDYFPEGRYANINLFKDLYKILSNDFEVGLYLTLGITTLFVNTYATLNPTKLLENKKQALILATGFDDGDLYNIGKLQQEGLAHIE